jgi:hypothetical protein
LHIAEDWYRTTALEDLLGLPPEKVNEDRLYRALDRMLPHKEALESHLRARLGELFQVEYDLLLYDVTSTYFEGLAQGNVLAQRGYSRDHRPDCKQVCIALVVTRDGLPLGYEVFAGNRTDVTTVEEIVTAMERRHGRADRIWVMDRGMTSEDNLTWLRQEGRRYLVGTPKSELKRWQRTLVEQRGWQTIREGIEVKLCAGPDGLESFILCRSRERRDEEQAMHQRFAERIRKSLDSLARRLEHARHPVDAGLIERRIGRLLERNTRAAGAFQIQVDPAPQQASGLKLHPMTRCQASANRQLRESRASYSWSRPHFPVRVTGRRAGPHNWRRRSQPVSGTTRSPAGPKLFTVPIDPRRSSPPAGDTSSGPPPRWRAFRRAGA